MKPIGPMTSNAFSRAMRSTGAVLLLAAGSLAQTPEAAPAQKPAPTATVTAAAKFAPPMRVKAGDRLLGEKRLYPSPVLQDMNGDGHADLVIGDLRGKITVALRQPGAGLPQFAVDTALKGRDSKDLDFANW